MPRSEKQSAFTLIEMSIILAIAGVFMALFISFIKPYYAEKIRLKNVAALQTVEDALSRYVKKYNRYPCPASSSAARGTADDGVANCAATDVISTAGARTPAQQVVIGAVPYRELNISANSTVDGYFNRLTYAVTVASTDDSTYNNEPDPTKLSGQIAILKTDDPANKTSMIPIPGGAHYFVFSRGRNGIGGYTDGGVFNAGLCPANEAENCNNDSTFASASVAYGAGNRYFDDLSTYNLPKNDEDGGTTPPPVAKNDEFWEETSPGSNDITNIHGRNVVINHPDPANPRVALEVKGGFYVFNETSLLIPKKTCTAEFEGSLRNAYHYSNGLEYCDGEKWQPVSSYHCMDKFNSGSINLEDKQKYFATVIRPENFVNNSMSITEYPDYDPDIERWGYRRSIEIHEGNCYVRAYPVTNYTAWLHFKNSSGEIIKTVFLNHFESTGVTGNSMKTDKGSVPMTPQEINQNLQLLRNNGLEARINSDGQLVYKTSSSAPETIMWPYGTRSTKSSGQDLKFIRIPADAVSLNVYLGGWKEKPVIVNYDSIRNLGQISVTRY